MALYVAKASNSFIQLIAQEYLLDFATMEKLAKKYNSSPGTISGILFRGVAENILDDHSANLVATKAMNNTENVVRTRKRWQKALKLRSEVKTIDLRVELDEILFKIATYDDYYFDEYEAPKKETLEFQRDQLLAAIQAIKANSNQ